MSWTAELVDQLRLHPKVSGWNPSLENFWKNTPEKTQDIFILIYIIYATTLKFSIKNFFYLLTKQVID